jgi:hypothetical protein
MCSNQCCTAPHQPLLHTFDASCATAQIKIDAAIVAVFGPK